MRRRCLALFPLLLAPCPIDSPSETLRASVQSGPDPSFHYIERTIVLPGHVQGRDALLLLDTGASRSAIDSAFAEAAGIQSFASGMVEGTAGRVTVRQARLSTLRVQEVGVNDLEVTLRPLGGLLAPPGRSVVGIIGMDFLHDVTVWIDYRQHRVRLSRSAGIPDSTWQRVSFTRDNGIPTLGASLNGTVATALRLDTGASLFESPDVWVNITTNAWKALQASMPRLVTTGSLSAVGVGGEILLSTARIDSMSIAHVRITRPWLIIQPEVGYFARTDAAGFVGNNFLEKYDEVIIDFAGNALYLKSRNRERRDA